jgi:ABC-type enterochelin transport system ATPase subunit
MKEPENTFMVFRKKGKVLVSDRPEEVLNADVLEDVYEIPLKIVPFDGRNIILR